MTSTNDASKRLTSLSFNHFYFFYRFHSHSLKTQAVLLQNCWLELFLIGYVQSSHSVSIPTIIGSLANVVENAIAQEKHAPNKLKKLSEHIWRINEFFQELTKLNLDDFEFGYLRFIILFNAGKLQRE